MPTSTVYPPTYLTLNKEATKQLNVVVEIAGVPFLFSTSSVYSEIIYGDPRIHYGDPGLVYGGLLIRQDFKPYLMLDSGLNVSQMIEPEQGRGSVATMTLNFIDFEGYMSELISAGVIIDEPLGNTLVQVSLGFTNSSFPQDYYKIFRGYVTTITSFSGKVSLELSDANIKRRQTIFLGGTSTLTADVDNAQLTIPINVTSGFILPIQGPDGSYDPAVEPYILVDNEFMSYAATGVSPTQITVNQRGARGTIAVAHNLGTTVTNSVQFQDNVINLALKIMLSGWDGPWMDGVQVSALGTSLDPLNPQPGGILFPNGVNVVDAYGITPGDTIYITGSSASNDGTYVITDIQDDIGETSNLVIVTPALNLENPATGVSLAFRSQYDTFPTSCGLQNTPIEVDVALHQQYLFQFFSAGGYTERLFISDTQNGAVGKDLIEGTLWLPIGVYSVTRYGRISLAVTKPPIAQQNLVFLDHTNVLDADKIKVTRSMNKRRFYNFVQFNYDIRDDGTYAAQSNLLDTTSLTKINAISTLPINADGLRTELGGDAVVTQRGNFILNRYKNAAYEITIKVNWQTASLIEVGDVIALADNGNLHITNLNNGTRDLGTQLFEVIQRSLDIKAGNASLTLLSSLGYQIGQRYATISPSSIVVTGSTTTSIEIRDSYGALYPGDEKKKWDGLTGLPIIVHDELWTQSATAVLLGFDPTDKYKMLVDPPLPFVPPVEYIVDVVSYGDGIDPKYIALYKTLYCFIDPSVPVASGTSNTVFDVAAASGDVLNVNLPILIHNPDYSILSPEVNVASIAVDTITTGTSIGFTPASGETVELIGFKDGGGPYRII